MADPFVGRVQGSNRDVESSVKEIVSSSTGPAVNWLGELGQQWPSPSFVQARAAFSNTAIKAPDATPMPAPTTTSLGK